MSYFGKPPATESQIDAWTGQLARIKAIFTAADASKKLLTKEKDTRAEYDSSLLPSGPPGVALRRRRLSKDAKHVEEKETTAHQTTFDTSDVDEKTTSSETHPTVKQTTPLPTVSDLHVAQQQFNACCNEVTETRPDFEQLRLETPSPTFIAAKNNEEHVQRLSYYGARVTTITGHDSSVTSLCTMHDGRLASASDDGTIKFWDASTGTLIKTLDNHMSPIYCLSTLPDSNLLACGSDTDITIWNTHTAKAVKVLKGHRSYVWCMAMVKMKTGEDVLASVSADKSLRLWCVDAQSYQYGECLSQAQEHRDSIYSLAVFPQQTCFATGSADTTVIIWRPSGVCVGVAIDVVVGGVVVVAVVVGGGGGGSGVLVIVGVVVVVVVAVDGVVVVIVVVVVVSGGGVGVVVVGVAVGVAIVVVVGVTLVLLVMLVLLLLLLCVAVGVFGCWSIRFTISSSSSSSSSSSTSTPPPTNANNDNINTTATTKQQQ